MKHISTDELKRISITEGLVLQGCGGDLKEWESGINKLLTDEGILLDGDIFKDIHVFELEGLTNMLFSMDDVKLDVGRLAVWRLKNHETFGGKWLSDFLPNRLGVELDTYETGTSEANPRETERVSVLEQIAKSKAERTTELKKPTPGKSKSPEPEL